MKTVLRQLLKGLIFVFGARVTDQRTGELLGKALFIPWGGKLRVIGLEEKRVIPRFESQDRLTYWHQSLGFSSHQAPDFLNEREAHDHTNPPA